MDSLEEPMKTSFKRLGLEESRAVLNFRRFILELRDNGLEEYLKNELTEQSYRLWVDQATN